MRIFTVALVATAMMPAIAIADEGRYQFSNGWVIDTKTGAVWTSKPNADGNLVMFPVPYRDLSRKDGKTLTMTPVIAAPPHSN